MTGVVPAVTVAVVVVLAGCTAEPPDSDPPTQTAPSVPAETGSGTSPSEDVSSGSPTPTGTSTADVEWGSYQNRADACAAVAADVVAVALLPMSLNLGADEEDVDNSEDKVEAMKEAAPPGLTADFAHVQLLLDSFGERLAEGERGGGDDVDGGVGADDGEAAGTGDGTESATGDNGNDDASLQEPQSPRFDREGLDEALLPVKDWLTEHCETGEEP